MRMHAVEIVDETTKPTNRMWTSHSIELLANRDVHSYRTHRDNLTLPSIKRNWEKQRTYYMPSETGTIKTARDFRNLTYIQFIIMTIFVIKTFSFFADGYLLLMILCHSAQNKNKVINISFSVAKWQQVIRQFSLIINWEPYFLMWM